MNDSHDGILWFLRYALMTSGCIVMAQLQNRRCQGCGSEAVGGNFYCTACLKASAGHRKANRHLRELALKVRTQVQMENAELQAKRTAYRRETLGKIGSGVATCVGCMVIFPILALLVAAVVTIGPYVVGAAMAILLFGWCWLIVKGTITAFFGVGAAGVADFIETVAPDDPKVPK